MKKPIDLNSLISSYNSLSKDSFKSLTSFFNFNMKDEEIKQIDLLLQDLDLCGRYVNYFYVGYRIPQIDKEFDLLRFGEDYILNIEIKGSFDRKKAEVQLIKNRYYLNSLNKSLQLFSYDAENHEVYRLSKDNKIEKSDLVALKKLLCDQKVQHYTNIDDLFETAEFLVSPFNDCDKFIESQYFLTKQQQEFRKNILNLEKKYILITGNPGTGKTLLLYDLARHFMRRKNIIIIHGGNLNGGHYKLKAQYDWNIISIRDVKSDTLNTFNPDIIFVDESQRIYPYQLNWIIDYIDNRNINGIFSLDPKQILSLKEKNYNNFEKLISLENSMKYNMSKKIRTNKNLGDFIKGFFNLNYMKNCTDINNISIHYYDSIDQAREFAIGMQNENWQIIDYTGQSYNGKIIERMQLQVGENSHAVLGQEFDKVIVSVGSCFYYNENKSLAVRGANYYNPERMLYQAITRTRKHLMILIVDNVNLMESLTLAMVKAKLIAS